jgi:hypothetical protein
LTTVATAAYSSIRKSVENTDDTTCALIILASPDQAQAGITTPLYDGTPPARLRGVARLSFQRRDISRHS